MRKGALLAAVGALLTVTAAGCGGPPGEGADEPAADTAAASDAPPDTAVAGRYFVRVAASADPGTLAERHGIRPDTVHTEKTRAFVATLTWGQVEALRADSLVRSLAQQIEGSDREPPEPQEVPVSDGG